MDSSTSQIVADILTQDPQEVQEAWVAEQMASPERRPDLITEAEIRQQSGEFLGLLRAALQVLQVVNEGRGGLLRQLFRAAPKHLLALLLDLHVRLAGERADHAELFRRDEVGHGLRQRVARKLVLRG